MSQTIENAYRRYRYLLSTIPRDHKKRYKTVDVLSLLKRECERSAGLLDEIEKHKQIIARANEMIIAEREGRKAPKCKLKPTSMRSPAVVKRSVRAALAR